MVQFFTDAEYFVTKLGEIVFQIFGLVEEVIAKVNALTADK